MRLALLTTSLLVIAAASPALAQTPVQRGETYVSAPWWMRAPVIATVPVGLSARTVRASEMPVSGGTKLGASSDAGARRNIASS